MGKLFDSLKHRGGTGGGGAAGGMSSAPRLAVVPAPPEVRQAADDHESMPFYEVPGENDEPPTLVTIAKSKSSSEPVREPAPARPRVEQVRAKLQFSPGEPVSRFATRVIAEQVVVVHEPDTATAAEYRQMAEHLAEETGKRRARSMTLLPVELRQPAAVLVANLGCAWADLTQHPIVLVDAARSLHDEGLARLLGIGSVPGWEELMTGAALGETVQQSGRAWLDVIAAGQRLARSNTQAWARHAGAVVHSLQKHYRMVLVLGPAYPMSPLGLVLAETTDSTCVIVAAEQVGDRQKDELIKAVAQQGGRVVGTVVVDG